MSITLSCPKCEARVSAPDTVLGKKIKCKKCDETFVAKRASRGGDDDDEDDRPRQPASRHRDHDEPRSRHKKRGRESTGPGGVPVLVGVLIIGAVTLISGGVATYFFFIKQDKPADTPVATAESTKPPAKADHGTASTANWVDFNSPDGAFAAKFPHQPSVKTQRFQTQGGTVESNVYEAHTGPVMTRLVAGGLPGLRPGDAISNAEIERWLELNCNAILRGINGSRQVSRKPVDIDGRTGRELEFAVDDGSAGVARVLIWKARMVILLVVDSRGKPEPAILEKYFGGFEPE